MEKKESENKLRMTVTVNGPGEVACWLIPLAVEMKKILPGLRICVALMPCVFATGREYEIIKSRPEIDSVCTVKETLALIRRGRLPAGFGEKTPGFVLHLGGDSVLSLLLARRMKQPCLAYVERSPGMQVFFSAVYYSGTLDVPKAGSRKRKVIGDLMVDAAWMRCPQRVPDHLSIGLYPGSRDKLAKYMLPFYAAVAEKTAESYPESKWLLAKSDFLSWEFLRAVPEVNDGRPIEGVNLSRLDKGGREYLVTPAGIRIEVLSPGEVAARAKLALTLPGSNTAELAALGVPMITIIPSWQAERIPWPGPAGHIGRIPLIGRYIKRLIGRLIYRRIGFAAHPNRRTQSMVVPEIVGHIRAEQVAEVVRRMLGSDLRPLEDRLRSIMGPPGAAVRLAQELRTFLKPENTG